MAARNGSPGAAEATAALIEQFLTALRAVDGTGFYVEEPAGAVAEIVSALEEREVREVVASAEPILEAIGLPGAVQAAGIAWLTAGPGSDPGAVRAAAARAGAGITSADLAVAEIGTLVLTSGPRRPRSLSLLPPLHVAVVTTDQLVADTPALFRELRQMAAGGEMPGSVNLITGPSRTGDIEHTLVRRVHGPGELLVILLPPVDGSR